VQRGDGDRGAGGLVEKPHLSGVWANQAGRPGGEGVRLQHIVKYDLEPPLNARLIAVSSSIETMTIASQAQ
jgi:hypothetical protein